VIRFRRCQTQCNFKPEICIWRHTTCLEETAERTYCCQATFQLLGLKLREFIISIIMECVRTAQWRLWMKCMIA